ncbi:unnamed protein product, partial [marine sediment metagenome]
MVHLNNKTNYHQNALLKRMEHHFIREGLLH